MRWRHTHQSLRFDVPVGRQVNYLIRLIKHQNSDILTCTEAVGSKVVKQLRKRLHSDFGKHWKIQSKGEFLIAWNSKKFPKAQAGMKVRKVSPTRWNGPKGGARYFRVATKVLKLSDGRRVRIDTGHSPAAVEAGANWKRQTVRTRAAQNGFTKWGKQLQGHRNAFKKSINIAVGDFNLDMLRPVWRATLESYKLGRCIWSGRKISGGTHGKRLIDGAFFTGAKVPNAYRVTGIHRPKGMDHTAITFVVEA